jgi:hydrogenase maturation factor
VLAYHLLWELTHVVFEHPGLLAPSDEPATEVCVTCSDEGHVVEVQARLGDHEAVVLAAGKQETVDVTLVGEPGAGDLLLVHAGVAIASIDEERQ